MSPYCLTSEHKLKGINVREWMDEHMSEWRSGQGMGSVLAFGNTCWMLLHLNSPPPSQAFLKRVCKPGF